MLKGRILGIDYGTKRVGIALSDENAEFALPKEVLKNDHSLMESIKDIVIKNGVSQIIIGESKNYEGKDNTIMEKVRSFVAELTTATGLKVIYEPEFMTSVAAARFQGENENIDASAAALILQSFLDKQR